MYVTHIRMQYMQCFNLSIQIYVLFFTYQYLYKIFDFDEKNNFINFEMIKQDYFENLLNAI